MVNWEPDTFYRFKMRDMWFETVNAIAGFLHAKPENTVMVTNVTTGESHKIPFVACYMYAYMKVGHTD